MRSGEGVFVIDGEETLAFLPASPNDRVGLVFLCGAGVSARAYAPLLRPIAKAGYSVFVIKLPDRIAPLESHKEEAMARARRVIATHPESATGLYLAILLVLPLLRGLLRPINGRPPRWSWSVQPIQSWTTCRLSRCP